MNIDHQKLLLREGVGDEAAALRWAHPFVTPILGRPPVDAAEAARVLCARRVTERRKELEAEPVSVSLVGKTCTCDLDDRSITRLNAIRMSGSGAVWKQSDGTFVPLSSEEVSSVLFALVGRQQILFGREAALKSEASTVTDFNSFIERVERFFP